MEVAQRENRSKVSQKWVFAILAFLALAIGNALRTILSITITAMVVPVMGSTKSMDKMYSDSRRKSRNVTLTSGTVYDWDEYTQGIILSSVYWGYTTTHFFYGLLSERFGGKYILGQGILVPAILTFLTPFAIKWGGSTALIVLRVMIGATSSAMCPVSSTMVAKWTVPMERAKIGGFIFSGLIFGDVIGTTFPALIILYSGMGWPAVFYFFGLGGMIWFLFWVLLCYNDPSEHPFESDAELTYLKENVDTQNSKMLPIAPFKRILTSKEFWAFVIGLAGCDWAYFTMSSELPKYMSSVLKFSIAGNGYLSALPYLCMWFNSIITSWISDQMISRNLMTLTKVRKLLTTVSAIGPAAFILAASYVGSDKVPAITAITIGIMLLGSGYPSIFVNNLDLSPNYAGTLMAIGNGLSAFSGILSPYIIGVLTPNQTIDEWRIVFWIGFVIAALASTFFVIYGTAEVQSWNNPNFPRDEETVDD